MAVDTKVGTFQTGTGAVSSTVTQSGWSFQPKFLYLHWIGRTESTDTVGRQTYTQGWGFVAGSSDQRCATTTSIDAGASSDGGLYYTAANCIAVCDGAGAATGLMALQSFDSGGFTLVVNDVMPASITVQYWAIGGSDITNVVTGTQTLAASTTGNVSVTGLTSASWEFGMFLTIPNNTDPITSKTDRCMLAFGAALSAAKQFVFAGGQDDNSATMDTAAYIYDGECIVNQSTTTPTSLVDRATFVSWQSDGYTVNVLEKDANVRKVFYVVFAGGSWDISGVTTVNDTSTTYSVSGLSFAPKAGLFVSANRAKSTQDTPTTDHRQSFGIFDSASNRSVMAILDENGTANAEVTTLVEFDAVYARISTASAIEALADVVSMDSGGVTFVGDDADPTASYCAVVTVGDNPITFIGARPSGLAGQRQHNQIIVQ
jgi:hypothetical protein